MHNVACDCKPGCKMADVVMMRNPTTGIVKKGFTGFSWTTLLFGGDVIMGLVVLVLNFFTLGIAGLIWAFFYNRTYTHKLIENGYEFADGDAKNTLSRAKLGITPPGPNASS
jgi:hypothetical protein